MNVVELLKMAAACEASGDDEGAIAAYQHAESQGAAEASVLLGQLLRRQGKIELARAAFDRGEAGGHSEAAGCLGNMLEDLGDTAAARVAYERGVAAGSELALFNLGLMLANEGKTDDALRYLRMARDNGDPEADSVIGQLLESRGDLAGAKVAYERGVTAGSEIAMLKYGQTLAADGSVDDALRYLQMARDNGAPGAHRAIGKLLEDKGDRVGAVEAYQGGADRGDADAAYGLGVVQYDLGNHAASKSAFERAEELGHKGAAKVLVALESSEASLLPGEDLAQLWSNVAALIPTVAAQRFQLGRQWIVGQTGVQDLQAKVRALSAAYEGRRALFTEVCQAYQVDPNRRSTVPSLPGPTPDFWIGPSGALSSDQALAFDLDMEEAKKNLHGTDGKWFVGGLRRAGAYSLGRYAARLDALKRALERTEEDLVKAERARDADICAAGASSHQALVSAKANAATAITRLPAILQPWSSDTWRNWTLDDASLGITSAFGGTLSPVSDSHLGPNASFGIELRIPWAMPMRQSWYVSFSAANRGAAQGFIRSLMVRHLASAAPGELQFCIFDPVGLGQSAGDLLDLAEYDADLVGGKIWTSSHNLEQRLAELSAHIELVIQKYLRTTYGTIDEFNDAAGEVAEPYRMLVLFDFPTGVSAEAAARLKSIAENGPRCGVFTIIAADSDAAPSFGVDPGQVAASMRRLDLQSEFSESVDGYTLKLSLDPEDLPARNDVAKRVIDLIGRASISRAETAVTFDKTFSLYSGVAGRGLKPELGRAAVTTKSDDPKSWWHDDSTRGLFAPIGQKGARDVAILGFDSSDHAGALLVGRPGSGKSTLLHTYIGGLTTLYGPEELDLYLIDFKEGVEFKAYAEEALPHAKVIAIESDREFGLSVLESLQSEISQRAEVLRATGGRQAGMQALREATGEKLPRVLLVFDEFQVLFSRNDKVGIAAADLLESVIRQGRGFGVHVLLGSQSLAGLDALGAHVPQLLPVRVLLPAAGADARKVLGDSNTAGDYLTTHGEGILNAAGGAVEANERFKGALLPEADRVARLQVLRDKADAAGFTRRPMVFEGNALVPLADGDPRIFREELTVTGTRPVRLRSGAPMTVGELGDVALSREAGANVLAIVRSGDTDNAGMDLGTGPAYGLLAAAAASSAMTSAVIDIIAFMPVDDGLDALLEPLLDAGRITLRRRRAFADVLERYTTEVADRLQQDDAGREARILFLFGVHRARELDAEVGSLDVDAELVDKLEQVMRDGPEVGVHVWLWSDSVGGASRRLTPRMMRETGWRIAGKMSADDSHTFIGTGQASDLRDSQLIITNEDRGKWTRVTAYSPPTRDWLTAALPPTPTESKEG